MEFWIILFSAILLIASIPYLRSFFKRVVMARKLRRACSKQKVKLHPTHLLWMFGNRYGSACDFYIETKYEVYSIKLFGIPRRLSVLLFTENGKFFIRYNIAFISYITRAINYPIDGKKKDFMCINFRKKFRTEWEIKTPRNILLINPVCREIRYQSSDRGGERIIGAGELVNNCEIQSLSRLISKLETSHE